MKKNRKIIIIAVMCVIALWIIAGVVDFAMVRNYKKPLFCIGVNLADDGGSGKYAGLGYSFEIEGNFMPEAKNPGVTSYRGYLFGREVCRGFWEEMRATRYKNMNDVIENAPSIRGTVTEVHEDYMIIYFVTDGYPYGADCHVSLNPVFGDSYTDVKVGDEVVVYFDGNIMETDPLQLGMVYAIILRTPADRNGVESDAVGKLIYGDMAVTDEPGMTEGDIVIELTQVTEPPELTVVCGEEEYKTLKGGYSWEYMNEDGTSMAVIADSAHPLDCRDIMPEVRIVYATISALHPRIAYLQFGIVPDRVAVRYWKEADWGDTLAGSETLEMLVTEADYADGSYSTNYSVELLEGNYIYEVIAEWNSAETYKGEARYSFHGVMGEYELVPVEK